MARATVGVINRSRCRDRSTSRRDGPRPESRIMTFDVDDVTIVIVPGRGRCPGPPRWLWPPGPGCLVAPDAAPPEPADELEDWVRIPFARVDLEVRARRLARIKRGRVAPVRERRHG